MSLAVGPSQHSAQRESACYTLNLNFLSYTTDRKENRYYQKAMRVARFLGATPPPPHTYIHIYIHTYIHTHTHIHHERYYQHHCTGSASTPSITLCAIRAFPTSCALTGSVSMSAATAMCACTVLLAVQSPVSIRALCVTVDSCKCRTVQKRLNPLEEIIMR